MIPRLGIPLALLLAAAPASADWPAAGVVVHTGAAGYPLARLDAAPGGHWALRFRTTQSGVLDQWWRRVAPDGALEPGWGAVPLGSPGSVVPDGADGSFVLVRGASAGGGVFAYALAHVLADGSVDPAWPAGGAPISSYVLDAYPPAVAPDGAGGAYVVYEYWRDTPPTGAAIRIERITSQGASAPGWPAAGVTLLANSFSGLAQGLASDGAGGAFAVVVAPDGGGVGLTAHHVRSDGTFDPRWTSAGISVGFAPFTSEPMRVVSHGTEASLLWRGGAPNAPTTTVMRIDANLDQGELAYDVLPMGTEVANTLAFDDGLGGLYVLWHQRFPASDVCGVHWLATGARAPGWSDPLESRLPGPSDMVRDDSWAAGPGPHGSLLLAWRDQRWGQDSLVVLRRTADGGVAVGWPANGVAAPIGSLLGTGLHGHVLAVAGDPDGRGWLAWHPADPAGDRLVLTPVGPVMTADAPRPGSVPALQVLPNPARDALTFVLGAEAGGRGGRLDLFDATGRRVRSAMVAPGTRSVRWSLREATLAPGVYLACWTSGAQRTTTRLAIVR